MSNVFLRIGLGCLLLLACGYSSNTYAETVWYPLPPEAYQFGKKYPEAQNLLFAFDYGHALVYEELLLNVAKIDNPEKFEKDLLSQIIAILKNPPATKVDESDIAPNYVFTFPLALNLLDWSHLLHQFVFDILVTTPDRGDVLKAKVGAVVSKYKENSHVVITDVCKTMQYMDGQRVSKDGQKALKELEVEEGARSYSKAFRRKFPSFNLLIWSYHWFQIRLYEDLMKSTEKEQSEAVALTVKTFWEMISNLPESADFDMMPETAKVAPGFAKMFPKLAASFDTNHSMHDIISDILVSKLVINKRNVGMGIARMARDPEAFRSKECLSQ
ncbi:MAG: hypothetical protein AABZ55_07810 [Bdellovibrionota bacterium]